MVAVMLGLKVGCSVNAWSQGMVRYRAAHPAASVQDLYKLAHQGILGSEHAVRDTGRVREWLMREVAEVRGGPGASPGGLRGHG